MFYLITISTNIPLGMWQSAASFREADYVVEKNFAGTLCLNIIQNPILIHQNTLKNILFCNIKLKTMLIKVVKMLFYNKLKRT